MLEHLLSLTGARYVVRNLVPHQPLGAVSTRKAADGAALGAPSRARATAPTREEVLGSAAEDEKMAVCRAPSPLPVSSEERPMGPEPEDGIEPAGLDPQPVLVVRMAFRAAATAGERRPRRRWSM